jgi:hypothetical protein
LNKGAAGSKDRARMTLIIAFIVVCGIGIGSSYFLGSDNPLEEMAEEAVEDMIEITIELPEETLHGTVDFTPSTPEKKRAYIDNG